MKPLAHSSTLTTKTVESRLEQVLEAADSSDSSSSGVLSMLWDYLGYLNSHLRGALSSFTWKSMLRNLPFNFGTLLDEARRIAESTTAEASRLLADFARRCIELFDWLLGANLLSRDADEVRAQQEKDSILEHATKARTESQGLINILSKASSTTIAIGKAFVSGILLVLNSVEKTYHKAINKCTELVSNALHRLTEWAMTNAKSVAIEMTRFYLFIIAAGERIAFIMGYAIEVAVAGALSYFKQLHAMFREYFGSMSTKMLNFLTEVVRPFISSKSSDAEVEKQLGDAEVGSSIFSGISKMTSTLNLVMWLIKLLQGGAVQAVVSAILMGFVTGIKNSAVMVVSSLISKIRGHQPAEFVSVTERIAMIRALQTSTGYTYVSKPLREQAERQIKAVERLSSQMEDDVRKQIRRGNIGSLLANSIAESWTSSRAGARLLFGEELSTADTQNSSARAATFAMISPGLMKNMDELQLALMRTHHAIAKKLDRHYSGVSPAAEGLDEDSVGAGAPSDEDRTVSPPGVSLTVAQTSWVSFMDTYSTEYRGYGKIVSDAVPNDPEDIRVAIEWQFWDRNNGRVNAVIKDIIELMLRRLYEEAKSKSVSQANRSLRERGVDFLIGDSNTSYEKDDIDAEIAAMRKSNLEEALNALKLQYDAVVSDRALVVLPLSSRDRAVESQKWRNNARMMVRGLSVGTGGLAAFELPGQVAAGLQSMVVAVSEMAFVDAEEEYYSTWARRVAFIKPIIMAVSVTLFIAYSAAKISNQQFGFDLARIAVPGRGFTSTEVAAAPDELKTAMKLWLLLDDKPFRDALVRHGSQTIVERWEKFGSYRAFSSSRTHDEAFSMARDTLSALHRMGSATGWKKDATGSAHLVSTQDEVYAVYVSTFDEDIKKAKSIAGSIGTNIFDRTADATVGRMARWINPAFSWNMQPRVLMNKFILYATKGYLVFAVGTVLVSFVIDLLLLVIERSRRAQLGMATKDLSLYRLTARYVTFGAAFGQLGVALWQHSLQLINNEINGVISMVPQLLRTGMSLGGAVAAFSAGDALTGGSMLLQGGMGAFSAFLGGQNIASGGGAGDTGGAPAITN